MSEPIRFEAIPDPAILRGNEEIAYRDPCGHYHDGLFRLWHTEVLGRSGSSTFSVTAVTESRDLITWSEPRILTPKDWKLNYSSPGNVIRFGEWWVLCLQTHPTAEGGSGDATSRVFTMGSTGLETWSEPRLIRVKGPQVPREQMGRMIDPYLIEDKDEPGIWWCFYKQNGASRSWSKVLKTWHYTGRMDAGENVCLLVVDDEYVMFHSPANGVGIKRSPNLQNGTDHGVLTLGQKERPWERGRLTAAHVLDLRSEPAVGKFVMLFHGSTRAGYELQNTHGHSSLGLVWSDDLEHWEWPE